MNDVSLNRSTNSLSFVWLWAWTLYLPRLSKWSPNQIHLWTRRVWSDSNTAISTLFAEYAVHRMYHSSSNALLIEYPSSVCPVLSWDTVCSSPSDIISRWATGIVTLKIHASIRIPNTKLSIRHCPSPSSQSGTAHHQAFNLALPNIKIWIRLRPILG